MITVKRKEVELLMRSIYDGTDLPIKCTPNVTF